MDDKFPLVENLKIHYLDSAATSQKPNCVINSNHLYYTRYNGNSSRGFYKLSMENTQIVENTRKKVANFVNVSNESEIVFTKGSTEGLNIIAFGYALHNLNEGDEIILGISNHHANIVPWQEVAKIKKLKIRYVYLTNEGDIDLKDLTYLINEKTRIISISSVVNTTGIIQSFKEVASLANRNRIIFVLDCAQSISHFKHDFEKWNIDFAVFSGHKMYANQGIGILFGKKELLEKTNPLIFGGDMVDFVDKYSSKYKESPHKFEAGTLNIEAILSLSKAIDFIDYEKFEKIQKELLIYAMYKLSMLDFIEIYYPGLDDRISLFSFNVKGVHSHDVSYILDQYKVAIRTGKHCTHPLLDYMNLNSTCRVSLDVYNTKDDIDKLVEGLIKVKEVFG